MLPIKKIYIDSRFKSSDSASHSDFKIDLPVSFLMPEDTGFYIDDVSVPHTWYPISERNNVIAFKFKGANYVGYVTPGNYTTATFGAAIATAMNNAYALGASFESIYDARTNKLSIALLVALQATNAFQIYTDVLFKEIYPLLVVRSINGVLKTQYNKVTLAQTI